MSPLVSIVIPAYNAASTLADTITSLQQQTLANWEAIVVDDGSQDSTVEVARQFVQQDDRFRLIRQPNQGVSVARNAGAKLATAEWLLFLDADDWIAPDYLEQMTAKITAEPALDVVHCGWVRVTPDGVHLDETLAPQAEELFPLLATSCIFAIHACLVRRSRFVQSGGFDPGLLTCEDWDLWQRFARQGCKFGAVPATLAFYRLRPQSLSVDGYQVFADGLRVIQQGHEPDPRVANPDPAYANGLPMDGLSEQKFLFAAWAAGLAIGTGADARPLLDSLSGPVPSLSPYPVVTRLVYALSVAVAVPLYQLWQHWAAIADSLQQFLTALATTAQLPYLAEQASRILERSLLDRAQAPLPLTIGQYYGIQLEVTEPIADILPPSGTSYLHSRIFLKGKPLGIIELPICDGWVAPQVLRDRITAQYAWIILGEFFNATVYRQQVDLDSMSETERVSHHNQMGWVMLLRDLWNRPDWSNEAFYDPTKADAVTHTVQVENNRITLELSDPLPHLATTEDHILVTLTVGGVALATITIPSTKAVVSAQTLRVALTMETGFELCRAVVREALIGQAWIEQERTEVPMLRQRLAALAQQRSHLLHPESTTIPTIALQPTVTHPDNLLILGQRPGAIGSSASRWASLPAAASEALVTMATVMQEPIAQTPAPHQVPALALYAPDAIVPLPVALSDRPRQQPTDPSPATVQTSFNNRNHFETLFAKNPDPWHYTNDYEQTKYEQTLSLLPSQPIHHALELACAEGHFTVQLAPRVQALLAVDISQIAVDRTAQRCAQFSHVRCQQMDMARDPFPQAQDLIVCSEVLYYIGGWDALRRFAHKVADALTLGGYFLTAHAHLVVDEPNRPGYDWDHPFGAKGISDVFSAVKTLRLVKELRTPLYRIQLFQKQPQLSLLSRWWRKRDSAPILLEQPQPTPPPDVAAHTVLWQGGQPNRRPHAPTMTAHLPILMYHRIAPSGSATMSQWRIAPDAFAAQLRYLRDAGYYSISLERWHQAMVTQKPLPGRAILLTFDDGYEDFFTHAYPLLREYGFSATVFLVADRVGQTNQWDAGYGENLALMTWEQIRQLQAQGIEFGSHSATHRPLTGLSLAEIVEEGARSRTILSQELGRPIGTIAYPHGDTNPIVEALMAGCGYTIGVTCRMATSYLYDNPLALPRLEIMGSDSLRDFITKLNR